MVDPEKQVSLADNCTIYMSHSACQKTEGPPESTTTARELDFDDEDVSSSPKPTRPTTSSAPSSQHLVPEETAPPQPPRPLNPRQQAEHTLKEAFPSIDATVVRAVLTASGGQLEPAFHALLGNRYR